MIESSSEKCYFGFRSYFALLGPGRFKLFGHPNCIVECHNRYLKTTRLLIWRVWCFLHLKGQTLSKGGRLVRFTGHLIQALDMQFTLFIHFG